MNLQLDEVTKTVQGVSSGPKDIPIRGYSIDTRTLNAGDLFFAVRGPRFDGHDFLQQAADRKAAAAVIDNANAGVPAGLTTVRVNSTLEALQTLARYVRRKWAGPIVGVTGSAGKTTTKELIAAVLAKKFNVMRTMGNFNNEYGLPLCLLRIDPAQTMAVLEMGMSAKGEIRRLAEIAEPNEGVITNVNPVHLEFFDSIEGIAEAKAELLAGLVDPRIAYLNNDDPRVRAMANGFSGKVVTYAVESDATFKAHQVRDLGLGGTAFTVRHAGRDSEFVLPLLGQHNVANALAAIAVGIGHNIGWDDVREAIAAVKPEKKRGEVVRFPQGFDVIDDSYNSNPRALTEMIRFVGKLAGYQRKIIVAGEMLELGAGSKELHKACGREAAQSGAALIIGVQGEARSVLDGAREAGAAGEQLKFAADSVEAAALVAGLVRPGDVVLIKGSRGVKLEQVLSTLQQTFSGVEA